MAGQGGRAKMQIFIIVRPLGIFFLPFGRLRRFCMSVWVPRVAMVAEVR